MKKIILTMFVAFVATASYSQRYCDLKVDLLAPASGSTITNGGSIAPSFKVTNLGSDTIAVADTVLVGLVIDGSPISNKTLILIFNKGLGKDSSITISYPAFALTFGSSANGSRTFCGVAQLDMPSTVALDTVVGNNAGCVPVTLTGGTGIGAINNMLASKINAYPNPAIEKVNFDLVVEKEGLFNFEIFDVSGKLVTSESHTFQSGNQSVSIDLNSLPSGVYSCKITCEKYSAISKFVIE